jgi:hypothetical protein
MSAVAVIVMPPTPTPITIKLATDADGAVGLDFTQALCVSDSTHGHRAGTLRDPTRAGLIALGEHLRRFLSRDAILLQDIIGNIIDVYILAVFGG